MTPSEDITQQEARPTIAFPSSAPRQLRLPLPILETLDATITAVSVGQAVLEMEANERLSNGLGVLHGGALCVLADTAMGIAYYSTLVEGESFTTVELKINYLKPVRVGCVGRLRAAGRVVKRGRTLGLVECDVVDDQGRLVARAASTCMTLRSARDERDERDERERQEAAEA